MAPRVGLEPTTLRLTAECSAIELPRSESPMQHRNVTASHKSKFSWSTVARTCEPLQPINLILATSYSSTTRCGSTITAEGLNCCVRYGNRWIPFAFVTKKLVKRSSSELVEFCVANTPTALDYPDYHVWLTLACLKTNLQSCTI